MAVIVVFLFVFNRKIPFTFVRCYNRPVFSNVQLVSGS